MAGCQFVDVADGISGVKLGDLKGDFTDFDLIEFASCDDEGHVSCTSYVYFTYDGTGMDDGWYDEEPAPANEMRIPLGAAVWFTGSEAKGVTVSGQVYGGTYTHTFTTPISMVCSAFPTAFNPNDTTRVRWDGVQDFDLIEVASCDEEGHVSCASYVYFTYDGTGMDDGWYDEEPALVEAPIAIGGQGFWLTLGDPTSVQMIEYSPIK